MHRGDWQAAVHSAAQSDMTEAPKHQQGEGKKEDLKEKGKEQRHYLNTSLTSQLKGHPLSSGSSLSQEQTSYGWMPAELKRNDFNSQSFVV